MGETVQKCNFWSDNYGDVEAYFRVDTVTDWEPFGDRAVARETGEVVIDRAVWTDLFGRTHEREAEEIPEDLYRQIADRVI